MRFKLGGVTFSGESLDEELMVSSFDQGSVDLRSDDTERPQKDGIIPGRDFIGKRIWAWELSARGDNLTDVLAANAKLEGAWRSSVRTTPGATMPLSYMVDGRWRRVYGRPGRYAGPSPDFIAMNGIGHIVCDFMITDPLHYDDAETSVVLSIVPGTTGGLRAPLRAPLSTVRSNEPRAGTVLNSGNAPTPLKVRFKGPVSNPWVRSADGWEVGIIGTLAYDQTITFDPLAGTVLRGSTPVNGMLTSKTRLSNTMLKPGTNSLTFGGTDLTGSATATLLWRDAYISL